MNARVGNHQTDSRHPRWSSVVRYFRNLFANPDDSLPPEEKRQFRETELDAYRCVSAANRPRFRSAVIADRRLLQEIDDDIQDSFRDFERRATAELRRAGKEFRQRLASEVRRHHSGPRRIGT